MDRYGRQRCQWPRAFQNSAGRRIASSLGSWTGSKSSLVAGWKPDCICGHECAYIRSAFGRSPDGTSFKLPEITVRRLGERVRFLPDGKSLIYMQGVLESQDFWVLDLASMKSRPLTRLQNRATMRSFDIASDGKQIVFDRLRENSHVVMIDLPKE